MGIYRCNQCGFVSEDAVSAVGARVPCGKCGTASTVYGTVFYVEKLVERYFAALREVAALKEAETPTDAATTPTTAASPGPLTGDAFNTDALATAAQHQPLQAWLATRLRINHSTLAQHGRTVPLHYGAKLLKLTARKTGTM